MSSLQYLDGFDKRDSSSSLAPQDLGEMFADNQSFGMRMSDHDPRAFISTELDHHSPIELPPIYIERNAAPPRQLKTFSALELEIISQRELPALSIVNDGPYPTPISPDFNGHNDPAFGYRSLQELALPYEVNHYQFSPFYAQPEIDDTYEPDDVYEAPPDLSLPNESKRRKSNLSNRSTSDTSRPINKVSNRIKTVGRKKTIVEPCSCSNGCGVPIAILYLRGHVNALEKQYIIDISCSNCCGTASLKDINETEVAQFSSDLQYVSTSRKRSRDYPKLVECEVCRKTIGTGGIRPVNPADLDTDTESLSVEYVCLPCGDKYQFCSECGGGGKTRTGKWRPKELFEIGRRTCALPHIRIGTTAFYPEILRTSQLSGAILEEIQDIFFDSYISFYATPMMIELKACDFKTILKERVLNLWEKAVLHYIQLPEPEHTTRYLIFEWMDKPHRNKAKTKIYSHGTSTWLKKIGLDPLADINSLTTDSYATESSERNYVSFGIAEWNHQKRTVFLPQIVPRSFFSKSLETYHHIVQTTLQRIRLDSQKNGIPYPEYIYHCSSLDNTRVRTIPEKLGFKEKEQFFSENPLVPRFIFEMETNPFWKTKIPS